MKLNYLCQLIFFLGFLGTANAQDKLLDRQGNEYLVKIIEITPDSIIYKPFPDSANASAYILPKAGVFMITYQNGMKEVFQESAPAPKQALSGEELYNQGRIDALKYYKPKGAYWGTFGTTLLYPPVGLVAGTAIALTPPARHNLIAPEISLLKEPAYVEGYTRQAKKQKLGKAAAGFGSAIGVYAVFFAIIIAAWSY